MGNHGHDFLDLENFIFMKSRENPPKKQNSMKFARNLIKHVDTFLKLIFAIGAV